MGKLVSRRRRRTVWLTALAAIAMLIAGFAAGRFVHSPAQEAADAAGPGPTVLTVPVTLQTLTAQVLTRGDVGAGGVSNINPPAATTGAATVTGVLVKVGQEVKQGQVLAQVSGRPVFALTGTVPAYRDLRPGYIGTDVKQLQEDLATLGFNPGNVNGQYGSATKSAVTAFYDSIGYTPQPASETDAQQLQSAANAVQAAQWGVQDAQTALNQAKSTLSANDPTVQTAQTTLSRAQVTLAQAGRSQQQTIETTGPVVPLGEYTFIPAFPAQASTVPATVGAAAPSPLLTVASGQIQAVGIVNAGKASLLKQGQPVDVLLEGSNTKAAGVVSQLSVIGGSDANAGSTRIVVSPTGTWPAEFWGQNVRLTVNGGSTNGPRLVVPVSALFASADGSTLLTVATKSGAQTRVKVNVELAAGGYAAVKPDDAGTLKAGDQVVVSQANLTQGASANAANPTGGGR